jgi:hypothetical protein
VPAGDQEDHPRERARKSGLTARRAATAFDNPKLIGVELSTIGLKGRLRNEYEKDDFVFDVIQEGQIFGIVMSF